MIDIFIEENISNKFTVYFVQLGCIYESPYSNLKTLCDNIVSLYIDSNSQEDGEIDFQYLPIPIYNSLYKKKTEELFQREINENIRYIVKKVC